jgi:hypothetical protein
VVRAGVQVSEPEADLHDDQADHGLGQRLADPDSSTGCRVSSKWGQFVLASFLLLSAGAGAGAGAVAVAERAAGLVVRVFHMLVAAAEAAAPENC